MSLTRILWNFNQITCDKYYREKKKSEKGAIPFLQNHKRSFSPLYLCNSDSHDFGLYWSCDCVMLNYFLGIELWWKEACGDKHIITDTLRRKQAHKKMCSGFVPQSKTLHSAKLAVGKRAHSRGLSFVEPDTAKCLNTVIVSKATVVAAFGSSKLLCAFSQFCHSHIQKYFFRRSHKTRTMETLSSLSKKLFLMETRQMLIRDPMQRFRPSAI